MQFFLAFPDVAQGSRLVKDLRIIRVNYMGSWCVHTRTSWREGEDRSVAI